MIVSHFGGFIDFLSEYQKGTTFYFTFELEENEVEEQALTVRENYNMDSIQERGKILVVDDEEFCHAAMRSLFLKEKIPLTDVVFCFDGEEAIRLIEDGHVFRVIFMDFNMPKLNGHATTSKIRTFVESMLLKQPIIVGLTGHQNKEVIDEGYNAGMDMVK